MPRSPSLPQVALLQRANPGKESPAWRIFDRAVTADEGRDGQQPRPIPADTWTELIDIVPAHHAFAIGLAAAGAGKSAAAAGARSGEQAAPATK